MKESLDEATNYFEMNPLKYWGFVFTAEIKVNKDAIGEKKIKKWGVEMIKAALTENLNPADLSIKEIVINADNLRYPSDKCFRVADSTVLEKVETKGVYFYPDEKGKTKALIIYSEGFREILDFSQLDLNMDTQKMLDNIKFPKEGVEKMTHINAGNRSGQIVSLLSRLKLEKSFKVFNLYCKLQEAKSLAKEGGKDSPRVVAILKECIASMEKLAKEEPRPNHLLSRMEKVFFTEVYQMEETQAVMILKGYLSETSQFSQLPKEVIYELLRVNLDLEEKRLAGL